jgi:hypothetical protein
MTYFRIVDDPSAPHWHLGNPADAAGQPIDGLEALAATPLECERLRLTQLAPGPAAEFTFGDLELPVVSAAVAAVLRAHADEHELQLIPATVGRSRRKWFAVNPLLALDCLNRRRSKPRLWKKADGVDFKVGQVRALERLVIDPTRAGGAALFRVAGWPVALIVSAPLAKSLREIGPLGVRFLPVEATPGR